MSFIKKIYKYLPPFFLQIADFGFSALMEDNAQEASSLRVLKSVVGSPFYVAPEVLHSDGYDGNKADVWSMGVIFYAMLAGNLPFGQELSSCKRFKHFCLWCREKGFSGKDYLLKNVCDYPEWLFPNKFSMGAKALLASMLHPEPSKRISVFDALEYLLRDSYDHLERLSLNNNNSFDNDVDEVFEIEMDDGQTETPVTDEVGLPTTPQVYYEPHVGSDTLQYKDLILDEHEPEEPSEDHLVRSENRTTTIPPAFHDMVKKSSRFITTVPAEDVIKTVECILLDMKHRNEETPIGIISRIDLNWPMYKLEVWTGEGVPACTLQLFLMTSATISCSLQQSMDNNNLYLVEFMRGQVDIFVFKRFYQWLRARLSKIVKRDYAVSFFESQQSPQ